MRHPLLRQADASNQAPSQGQRASEPQSLAGQLEAERHPLNNLAQAFFTRFFKDEVT
jgi:hypothetical protein